MINGDFFEVEPWSLTEKELHQDHLSQTESLFALVNGHVGLRGNLDEGEPNGTPGTYLNGFFESRPLPYAEGGYGYPEEGQTLINVTNGKLIRLLVDDEPFDVRYGGSQARRSLDFRTGCSTGPPVALAGGQGGQGRLDAAGLVRPSCRGRGALRGDAVDEPLRIVVQSTLVANESTDVENDDPRAAAALPPRWSGEFHTAHGPRRRARPPHPASGLRMAAGIAHTVDGPEGTVTECRERGRSRPRHGEHGTAARRDAAGGEVRGLRLVEPARHAGAARPGGRRAGVGQAQRLGRPVPQPARLPRRVLGRADIEIDGDDELQQAVRYRCSRCSRPRPAPSDGPSPPRG